MKASHITALKMTAHALLVLAGYLAILALVSEDAALYMRLLAGLAIWAFIRLGRRISPEFYRKRLDESI